MVRWERMRWSLVLTTAAVLVAAGCNKERHARFDGGGSSGGGSRGGPAGGSNAAEQLLEQMIAAYAKADTYADRGELVMQFQSDGKPYVSRVPFSVMFVRPNKLRMNLYQGTFICDGRNEWGWVDDLPGYILKRPAPAALTLGEIYSDPVLGPILNGQVGGSLQLAMMLGAGETGLFAQGGNRPELMSDDYIDSFPCRRIRVTRRDGNLVYWIDRDNLVLRRIEFPTGGLPRQLLGVPSPTDLRLTAEIVEPLLNSQISDQPFDFQPPPQVKLVDRLEAEAAVEAPKPPAATLGKKLGEFSLTTLDGKSITNGTIAGKTAVFVFWSFEQPASLHAIVDIDDAFRKLRSRNDVMFVSVSIDPMGEGGIRDAELTKSFADAKLELPIARDPARKTLPVFDVNFVPTLFVIGPDGTVEYSEVGLSPQLESKCAALVERAAAGESLVALAQQNYRERLAKYEQSQKRATQPADADALPKAQVAPAGAPKHLKLTTLWKSTDLKQPGYVLGFDDPAGGRVLAADGLRAVAELDGEGKLVRRVELDLPKEPNEAVVSYWRTATDAAGKRYFAGSAGAQLQLHLFDREFKKLLSFPEGTHPGISDVELADLDGDGKPEILVGYWETIGVQAVGLDGTRLWSNRKLPENVQRLATSGKLPDGSRMVLATTGRMDVVVLDKTGTLIKEMPVGDRAARLVTTADLDGDGSVELAAITGTGPGTDVIVGINGAGAVTWSYTLPAGVQPVPEMQNEMLVGGRGLEDGTGVWVAAGADGTIHVLSADGKLLDSWAWGEAIRGINLATIGGRPALVVSDAKGVTALRLAK